MSLPALYLKPSHTPINVGAVLDDPRLDLDTLVTIVAKSDCGSALSLSAVNQQLRNLMMLPEFWMLVVNLRLEQGETLGDTDTGLVLDPFQQYFLLCFRRERTIEDQKRAATDQLRLSVDLGRWEEATLALKMGADVSVYPVDNLRPTLFNPIEFLATDAIWPSSDLRPQPEVLEFAEELIKRGGIIEEVSMTSQDINKVIETAVCSLNALLITLTINSEFVYDQSEAMGVRTGSVLWKMLIGEQAVGQDDLVLMRWASRLKMVLPKSDYNYLANFVPRAVLTKQTSEIVKLLFANSTEVLDMFESFSQRQIEAELLEEARLAERAAIRTASERRRIDDDVRRVEAERLRQKTARERSEFRRTQQERASAARQLFRDKLADAKRRLAQMNVRHAEIANGLEALTQRLQDDPFSNIEYTFRQSLNGDWPTLRQVILDLIESDEVRAAVTMTSSKAELLNFPEFLQDDELLTRMLATDETTQPNLADVARELLVS